MLLFSDVNKVNLDILGLIEEISVIVWSGSWSTPSLIYDVNTEPTETTIPAKGQNKRWWLTHTAVTTDANFLIYRFGVKVHSSAITQKLLSAHSLAVLLLINEHDSAFMWPCGCELHLSINHLSSVLDAHFHCGMTQETSFWCHISFSNYKLWSLGIFYITAQGFLFGCSESETLWCLSARQHQRPDGVDCSLLYLGPDSSTLISLISHYNNAIFVLFVLIRVSSV